MLCRQMLRLLLTCLVLGLTSSENDCPSKEEEVLEDPRLGYNVEFGNYLQPADLDVSELIREMSVGDQGYVIIPGLFEKEEIEVARKTILCLIKKEGQKATHFQGSSESSHYNLQARVWNLLNKGALFRKMVQHPIFIQIGSRMLGKDFQLGSMASNTIFPGGTGQEPHIDYPYWDYFKKENWPNPPKHEDVPFFMNMQATIMLDEFTEENGATAVRPGTQRKAEYPWDKEEFRKHQKQAKGNPGDVMLFFGLLQHCAMPNRSNASRTGLIIQFLPKYIRPMEDLKASIAPDILKDVSPELRSLLLLDYPYPSVLDEAEAENKEGVGGGDDDDDAKGGEEAPYLYSSSQGRKYDF